MKTYFKYFILFLLILSFDSLQITASEAKAKVVVDEILLNGKSLDISQLDNIVIAETDTLHFFYHCHIENAPANPFLFRITLKNPEEESMTPTNTKQIAYYGLNENDYSITISAFDPRNQWVAVPFEMTFRVNNREAELLRHIINLKEQMLAKDTVKTLNEKPTGFSIFGLDLRSLIIGAVVIAVFVSLVLFVYILLIRRKNKDNDFSNNKWDNKMDSSKSNISKAEFDKISVENSNLRAEIAALRGQIDAMQVRSQELGSQNKELNDKVEKLSKSKQEIEELQKQKDELFAVIIHDIKNPASLIKSLVELLRSYDLTAVEQQEVIEDIVETTSKIVALSQEVSRILALEGNSLKLNIEACDVREIIKDVHKRNQIAANNKAIEVLLELSPKMPDVDLDPQRFDEVVENLLSNAIKFSPKGGKIKIATKPVNGYVEISVSDNGLGLSESDIQNAFQRGVKLTAKPTANEPSSGLGLWIVKKLVEAHQGRVRISSLLGKGSTFTVIVPTKFKEDDDNK